MNEKHNFKTLDGYLKIQRDQLGEENAKLKKKHEKEAIIFILGGFIAGLIVGVAICRSF